MNNTTTDALIIRLVIDIGHYWSLFLVSVSVISERCNRYCNKCTNNVISCEYSIINCFYDNHNHEKMLIIIERIRNQKVDIIPDRYQLSVHIYSNY